MSTFQNHYLRQKLVLRTPVVPFSHLRTTKTHISFATAQADKLVVFHCIDCIIFEPPHEKTNVLVFDLVRHKPGCTATEDGQRLEISDLESRVIVLSMQRKQRR